MSLLAPGGHGRVAGTLRAVPVIIPVSFTLVDDDVVFDPGAGEGLSRAVGGAVVAFETDHAGPDGRPLWSVHITGVATASGAGLLPAGFRLSSRLMSGWRAGG